MHCSANVGKDDDVALFFGLSGTGKTTLSADPKRNLIGDDEHGWSDEGVYNFEGGCYAKVIRLSADHEPEIYATHQFGTILENVVFDPVSRKIDLDDDQVTENTRGSYPFSFIPNAIPERYVRTHPKNVIFLTCDAQGVMPPISRLDTEPADIILSVAILPKSQELKLDWALNLKSLSVPVSELSFMVHHPYFYAASLKEKYKSMVQRCGL